MFKILITRIIKKTQRNRSQ